MPIVAKSVSCSNAQQPLPPNANYQSVVNHKLLVNILINPDSDSRGKLDT